MTELEKIKQRIRDKGVLTDETLIARFALLELYPLNKQKRITEYWCDDIRKKWEVYKKSS